MRISSYAPALLAMASMLAASPAPAASGDTVNAIKARGHLICGSDAQRAGFSGPDSQGVWHGFDVDFCRAIATAVLGDAMKVEFVHLSPTQRFPSLQSGEVDVLSRVTTYNLTRDASLGLSFAPVNFYSGTKLMVHASLGVKSARELDGASICIPTGSSQERAIADYFRKHGMSYNAVTIDNVKQIADAYLAKRCDAMANFEPGLAIIRMQANQVDGHVILPEDIEKEPLGPAVREGDERFADIVRWTVYATIEAEELGLNSGNVDAARSSDNPRVQRLLGVTGDNGEKLGLPADWAYQVIKQVGSYEEIFENNVGARSPLKLGRALNQTWENGGLLYAPPFQ